MTLHSHRQQFAINASLYGKRGGQSKSPTKLAAIAKNRVNMFKARQIEQAKKGRLFQVVGTDFMGNDRACRHYVKSNGLKEAKIVPVLVSQLS